jgi:hypothetical protein
LSTTRNTFFVASGVSRRCPFCPPVRLGARPIGDCPARNHPERPRPARSVPAAMAQRCASHAADPLPRDGPAGLTARANAPYRGSVESPTARCRVPASRLSTVRETVNGKALGREVASTLGSPAAAGVRRAAVNQFVATRGTMSEHRVSDVLAMHATPEGPNVRSTKCREPPSEQAHLPTEQPSPG